MGVVFGNDPNRNVVAPLSVIMDRGEIYILINPPLQCPLFRRNGYRNV
jgi:hypothetical protein